VAAVLPVALDVFQTLLAGFGDEAQDKEEGENAQ
jgi:hypothetical protein